MPILGNWINLIIHKGNYQLCIRLLVFHKIMKLVGSFENDLKILSTSQGQLR